jgi:hypothetical protein
MTLPGETIHTGASQVCPDCKLRVELEVLNTPAGFYIGAWCNCGPYCRETSYFPTREAAEAEFEAVKAGTSQTLR